MLYVNEIMVRFITILILILSFGLIVSAQEITSSCPTIKVTGADQMVESGDIIFFTAEITGDVQKYPVKYKWTIDQGTITSGQGTKLIRVDTTGLSDTTIKAVFEVSGLPENSSNSGSETSVVSGGVMCSCSIADIYDVSENEIRVEIDNVFMRLQTNPTTTAYLITYGQVKEIKKREKLIESHIKMRRYDRKRIVFLSGVEEVKIRTQVYLVPEGVEPPTP